MYHQYMYMYMYVPPVYVHVYVFVLADLPIARDLSVRLSYWSIDIVTMKVTPCTAGNLGKGN